MVSLKMEQQPQEDFENAENSEVALTSDVPPTPGKKNVFVFLDFEAGGTDFGRVVIELFVNIAPRTCENFRQLCCKSQRNGRTGKPLWFKGSIIHKIVQSFMIQGGDITNFDGTGGESIYGDMFEDESFEMKMLDVGILGMANLGQPNTNSSQFFISCDRFPHLYGKNVAFGKVRKGFGVVKEISCLPTDENHVPKDRIVIKNCGELPVEPSMWNYSMNDGKDQYPPYPEDWELDEDPHSLKWELKVTEAIKDIKDCGNDYLRDGDCDIALRKYMKAVRYLTWGKATKQEEFSDHDAFGLLRQACLSNMAATYLRLKKYRAAYELCTEVLNLKGDTAAGAKDYFRRGKASFGLHDYDASLKDLKKALELEPGNKTILNEIDLVISTVNEYKIEEKKRCANMLQL